jgi:cell division protein ZapA
MNDARNVVTVQIAGEEYGIRAVATPEHTRECAAHVDQRIGEILRQGTLVQAHKAAILAALGITDELFQARRELEELRAEVARLASRLAADVQARLGPGDLASRR